MAKQSQHFPSFSLMWLQCRRLKIRCVL